MQKSVSLADQVFAQLEKDILTGKYSRGDLLTEMQVSEELGVSRTPVREALSRLEHEHLIESASKGMKVLGVSAQDAEDIYQIRKQIETLAASYCAQRITDDQLKELSDIVDYQELCVQKGNHEQVKVLDSEFHHKIYEYTGSIVLYDTLAPLHTKIQKFRQRSIEAQSRAKESNEEHRMILEALRSRDPERAKQAMLAHLTNAHDHLKKIKAI